MSDNIVLEAERFTHAGRDWLMTLMPDHDSLPPWEREQGHGPVSEWTSRDIEPGELILTEDDGSRRFYDMKEAKFLARRDGWLWLPGELVIELDPVPFWSKRNPGRATCRELGLSRHDSRDVGRAIEHIHQAHKRSMSETEYVVGAARADFAHLKRWCQDDWRYVDMIVELSHPDGTRSHGVTMGGIEWDAVNREATAPTICELREAVAADIAASLQPAWMQAIRSLKWRLPLLMKQMTRPFTA